MQVQLGEIYCNSKIALVFDQPHTSLIGRMEHRQAMDISTMIVSER